VSTQAARQRIAAAEQHSAQLIAEAEARAEAIRDVRDELTGRLLQVRQLLSSLPDLSDRPQQQTSRDDDAPAPAARETVRQEEERRPQPTARAAAPATSGAAPATSGAAPATSPSTGRGESEAAAARQPLRNSEPATRQLPMPPRPGSGSTAASATGPSTQAIDQPVGQGGR
jgi:hypothetical protein